jgi:hypothetical protein
MRLLLLVLLHQFEVLLVSPERMLVLLEVLLVQVLLTLPRTLCRRLAYRLHRALAVLPLISVQRF